MKRRSLLSLLPLAGAIPLLAACGSGPKEQEADGAAAGSSPTAAPTPDDVATPPTEFGPIDTGSRFQAASVGAICLGGLMGYGATVGAHAAYYNPFTKEARVLVADQSTGEYSTVAATNDQTPTELATSSTATYSFTSAPMVVDDEHGYAVVGLRKKGGDSKNAENRIDVVKVRLSDGGIVASQLLWDDLDPQKVGDTDAVGSNAGTVALSLSEDSSLLLVNWLTKRWTSVSVEDLSTVYTAPDDLGSLQRENLLGDYLRSGGTNGYTLTSLKDGSKHEFDSRHQPAAVFGGFAYVAEKGESILDMKPKALNVVDLATGASTAMDSMLEVTDKAALMYTSYSSGYLVTCGNSEFDIRKPGETTAVLHQTKDSGTRLPTAAAVFGDIIYAFLDDFENISLLELATGKEISKTSFAVSDAQFKSFRVHHFGAMISPEYAPATAW